MSGNCGQLGYGPCDNVSEGEPTAFHHDGAHYDSALEAFGMGVLGFCGCGDPEGLARTVLDYMRWLDARPAFDPTQGLAKITLGLNPAFDTWRATKPEMSDTEEMLIGYLIDDKGLTEHGGSIYGAWLTDDGKNWMAVALATA